MTAAELLLATEARLGIAGWALDTRSGQFTWTPLAFLLHGLAPADKPPSVAEALALLDADSGNRFGTLVAQMLAGAATARADLGLRQPAGARLHCTALALRDGVLEGIVQRSDAEPGLGVADTLAAIGVGWFELDLAGGHARWSERLLQLHGLPLDAVPPTRAEWREHLLHPDDLTRADERAAEFAAGNGPYELDYRIRRADDGTVRWLHTRSVLVPGSRTRCCGVTLDVTERKRAEASAAEAWHALEMSATQVGFGFGWRAVDADAGEWSVQLRRLFGLPDDAPRPSRSELIAMLEVADRERMQREIANPPAPGELREFEFRVPRPDGSLRTLVTRSALRSDDTGRPWRVYFVVLDITERRAAEAALQAQAVAERANAAKTEFLARMSHELRTPLNAMLGFAQLLALDASDAQRARIAHIESAGWHLLALIDDVLDLARIESRQTVLNPQRVPWAELATDAVTMQAAAATGRQVRVVVVPDAGAPVAAWADRTRFKQLLLNLVSNAVKYNRPGGFVELSGTRLQTGEVMVRVRDGGPGLTAEELAQLFEPFNRLGRETSGIEGTGIGLALSKRLAEQMGGRIEAESTPGQGSEFRLVLPGAP